MDLSASIRSGITFLQTALNVHGWWEDYDTLAGSSDEWVTAYVAGVLADNPDPQAIELARRAWRRLNRRRWWSSGWGYNGRVPLDADSTAWALRLAQSLGCAHSFRARRARRFLINHLHPSGGLSTYALSGPIRRFTRLNRSVSFEGWCGIHLCVTAGASSLPFLFERKNVRDYLRRSQAADGRWAAYWWPADFLSTYLAAEALSKSEKPADRRRIERASQWAASQLGARGRAQSACLQTDSAFNTALCLRILLLDQKPTAAGDKAAQRALQWLLSTQRPDGSWPSSAVMRIPPPNVVEPDLYQGWQLGGRGGGSLVRDQNSIFTTATVLGGLVHLQNEGDRW